MIMYHCNFKELLGLAVAGLIIMQSVMILGLVGPLFLFPSRPLSLLTHLGPLPSNSHRPLPIYSTDPLMRTPVP